MSNPLTQKITANENNKGNGAKAPVTAKYAPKGASDKPMPNTRWQSGVKRFV